MNLIWWKHIIGKQNIHYIYLLLYIYLCIYDIHIYYIIILYIYYKYSNLIWIWIDYYDELIRNQNTHTTIFSKN